jgi:protein Tex
MNDLEVIARDMRVSVDVLKRPAELLKQGYEPAFLGTYRLDELGQMDTNLLARLKRGLEHRERLAKFKEKIKAQGHAEGWWNDSIQPFLDQAQSIAEIDGVTRNIRSRKSSRLLAQKNPKPAELGQAILTLTGPPPESLEHWAAQQAGIDVADAGKLLHETKHWLQVLLSEDAALIYKLGRQIIKRSQISVTLLADQPEKPEGEETTSEDTLVATDVATSADVMADLKSSAESESVTTEAALSAAYADAPSVDDSQEAAIESAAIDTPPSEASKTSVESAEVTPSDSSSTESTPFSAPADPLSSFPNKATGTGPLGKIVVAKKKIQTVSFKQLSPRQRRRRWLRSILQRYSKMKKPLNRLSHYQALMLGRGQRSQIISLKMDYDHQAMTRLAREAFCPGNHPLHGFLIEVADEALKKSILPKLEHDVFAEIEEAAHGELVEMAVRHLQEMLQRRPVRGHRILVIDAMGPKTAAIAIVDPVGHVEFTGDLSSMSSRPDVVTQNVTALGQLIHQHKVSLVALSNGNTRRYLIHTVNELMKQSGEGGLRWTIVDRTGADSYCENRQSLHELPRISKRHRAAVWLAWRLQDPLIELTKVDPARLRLGSYQRELPQDVLEDALTDVVSSSVAARGVDVWNSHEKSLVCLPGVDKALARAIVELRDAGQVTNRESLAAALKEKTTESQLRQAIGYLRVFESDQTLDGTMIHPDDYRLAERLIAAGQLVSPSPAPENWKKPKLASSTVSTENVEAAVASDPTAEGNSSLTENQTEAMVPVTPEISVVEASEAEAESATIVSADSEESPGSEATIGTEASVSPDASAPTAEVAPEVAAISPENPTEPTVPPALTIDVERLARSWQVGREKMRMVARCLQQPFSDSRDAHMPIPLMTHVPTIENLKPGMMAWGIVVGVADFGAFVDLGPDCSGLIHVSRLSKDFVEDPHEVVQMGDLLQVWVINVDLEKKRIGLSALPPGMEQSRRPSFHDQEQDTTGRPQQGRGQFDRQQGDRPRSNDRGSHQRGTGPNQGTREGQPSNRPGGDNRGGPGQGRGGPGQPRSGSNQGQRSSFAGGRGRDDRGQGDRRRNEDRSQAGEGPRQARQNKPPKPAPPITDAMQQGIEPMRTFGDLLQFYQVKREEPTAQTKPAVVAPEASSVESVSPPEAVPVMPANSPQTSTASDPPTSSSESETNAT